MCSTGTFLAGSSPTSSTRASARLRASLATGRVRSASDSIFRVARGSAVIRQFVIRPWLSLPAFFVLSINLYPVREGMQGGYVGSSTCGSCHAAIFKKYFATPMARSSGKVGSDPFQESLKAAQFTHAASGTRYRILRSKGGLTFEFSRRDPLSNQEIRGERRLDYYIGSGAIGRSYAHSQHGFLFQAPVSYYSAPAKWEIS